MAMMLLGSTSVRGRPGDVAGARDFVAGELTGLAAAESAVLLTSELVTNSVLHSRSAGGRVDVAVHASEHVVRVEVTDAGGGAPVLRPARLDSTDGHGLHIVAAVAKEWGSFVLPDLRRRTWFTIAE